MPQQVKFSVINNVTENTGQRVLVFLTPTDAETAQDFNYAAWKTLNPSANGGCQPFEFQDTIQLKVLNQNSQSCSALKSVEPNQLWDVSNADNQGPVLSLTNETPQSSKVTAVRNATDPVICLESQWYVNNSPVVSQSGLNLSGTATFELASTLFFMLAIPTRTGFNWRFQQFSNQFSYVVPQGITSVTATWSRPGGPCSDDVLTFDPPSAPRIPQT